MHRFFIFCFLFFATCSFAQPYQFTPVHTYESFYMKFRREQFKTTLADYELSGPVKEVLLFYVSAKEDSWSRTDSQRFVFSKDGLLLRYVLNDPATDRTKWSMNQRAETREFHYNKNNQPDTVRITEFFKDSKKMYWYAYNADGFMTTAGRKDRDETVINYTYRRDGSMLSVTTKPFQEYDITGNVIADTVHFLLDKSGRVTMETMFYSWGTETISFAWQNDTSFTYSIRGRSHMAETGSWSSNIAGRMVRSSSEGYYINHRGQDYYSTVDSLAYNSKGWIVGEYSIPHNPEPDGLPALVFTEKQLQQPAKQTQGLQLTRRYVYATDAHGNWTAREHYDANGSLVRTEMRRVTYY